METPLSRTSSESQPQRANSQEALLWFHGHGKKELSVGLELECFLPDLGALTSDRLVPVEKPLDLFTLVADELSQRLRRLDSDGAHRCRSAERRVSANESDWGCLWTATADGSIIPQGANPFPVELVSKRMHFDELDVALFCDMVHALRTPPLRAATNESTGLHVHMGKYPHFFSLVELAMILKTYLRFEDTINKHLLPVTRHRNRFCRDLREVLAQNGGFGNTASDEQLFSHIDRSVHAIQHLTPEDRALYTNGLRGHLTQGSLLVALLGEGTLWRSKIPLQVTLSASGACSWIPVGMVLRELKRNSEIIWKIPSCEDLQRMWGENGIGQKDISLQTPFDVLGGLENGDEVECLFTKPDDVQDSCIDFWLFRDGLIFDRHGARYCKLNIMRVALPSEKATIEFRQFPGGDFNQPLLIWGWVKFLGLLVTHACAVANKLPGAFLPSEGSEAALKSFLRLSNDTMLVAWFQDVQNRLQKPEAIHSKMRMDWDRLWTSWSVASRREGKKLLVACDLWRRIFQAAAGMRSIFPQTDQIWQQLAVHQKASEDFMQRLYSVLEQKLAAYVRQLAAASEVSKVASLSTVVQLTIADRTLHRMYEEIRTLQSTIAETRGWETCSQELKVRISNHGSIGAELMLDHARNLLTHCEDGVAQVRCSIRNASENGIATGYSRESQIACEYDSDVRESVISPCGADSSAGVVILRLVQDVYHELTAWLLAPRVKEAQGMWKGLSTRGWTSARVEALNSAVAQAAKLEALAVVAQWNGAESQELMLLSASRSTKADTPLSMNADTPLRITSVISN